MPSPKTTPKTTLATPHSSQRPSLMPRSQTVPSSLTDARPSGKATPSLVPLRINTSKDEEDPTPTEICLSPSWSDHGEKKRRKEKKRMEKEQKEIEKRLKQDQERQRAADIKAGKRLSKNPPPAAMETQKMPQALRRNSWVSMISSRSSSGENTRRSSREENRLSGISIGSMDLQSHPRSTPATSTEEASDPTRGSGQWHSVVSSAAPKIPNFGWSSRRTSSGTNKTISWGSEDAYTREVISFAYRLEGSPTDPEHNKLDEPKAQQGLTTPIFSRSVTEPNLASITQQSVPRSPPRSPANRKDSSESRSKHGQKDPRVREHRDSAQSPKASPNFQVDLAGEMEAIMASHHQRPIQNPPPPRSPRRVSSDGSSYVHKQRMYQQQRSIAGFEDEQAVEKANDMAARFETLTGEDGQHGGSGLAAHDTHQQQSDTASVTPNNANNRVPLSPMSSDSVMQPNVNPSPVGQQSSLKQQADAAPSISLTPARTAATRKGQEGTQIHASSLSVRNSVSLNKTQTAPGSKTDKILGFRRRSKMAPSQISVPDNAQSDLIAHQSVPPAVTVIEGPPEKRSKVERTSQETKQTQLHSSGKKRSESSARSQPRENLPEPDPIHSHARNRTSSSTVLSDNLPSPVSPKSKTEPGSVSSKKTAKQAGDNGDGREPHLEAEPESPHSKRNSVTTNKALPDIPSAAKDAPAPEDTTSKSTPTSKPLPEATISKATPTSKPLPEATISKATPTSKSSPEATASKGTSTSEPLPEATTSKAMPTTKPVPEVVVESTTEEGLVRKTSIKRPRSNPQLQTQTTVTNSLPSLDFLPQLKHQPLVKRQPHFLPVSVPKDRIPPVPKDYATIKSMAIKSKASSHAPDLELIPRSPLRPSQFPVPGRTFNRSATDVGTVSFGKGALVEGMEAKPMAKLFVICCKCKFWHDLPSKLYEAMALPKELQKEESIAGGNGKAKLTGAKLETAVKCPWCEHAMTTWCCQGWTTVVYLHERHH